MKKKRRHTRGKERKRRTQFRSRRHRKPRPVSDARVAASYQFNRLLMNGQIGFLKVPLCHRPLLLSPSPIVVSPFFASPRLHFLSIHLAIYAFVSPVNSFVIRRFLCRSLRHCITSAFTFLFLRLLLHHRFAPRLFTRSSLYILAVFLLGFFAKSFSFLRKNEGMYIHWSLLQHFCR